MTYIVEKTVRYRGADWVVLPGVFEPRPDFGEPILVTPRNREMYEGKRVLDIGCGCGVRAIIASLAGATSVAATDIMPNAIWSTRVNVALLGAVVDVFTSDLFSRVSGEYDAIVAYLPSFDLPIAEYADIASNDPGLVLHHRLMAEAKRYLAADGVLHIAIFGDNVDAFRSMVEYYNYKTVEYKVYGYGAESWHFFDLSA